MHSEPYRVVLISFVVTRVFYNVFPGSEALSRKWLSKMPDVCRGDAALVRLVLRRDGVALQHATEELKAGRITMSHERWAPW